MHLQWTLACSITTTWAAHTTKQRTAQLPSFALQYAPIVYLYDQENFYPADIGTQIKHTTPKVNYTAIPNAPPPTLDNLSQLNNKGGTDVYLTSKDDVTNYPSWLYGVKPDATGQTQAAVSGVIIAVEKGNGITDVFYMYFYAFDYGGDYFGVNVGNHVGDWEHNMIRFQNGKPQAVWYSQHSNGRAFEYAVTEKYQKGVRPIAYSANGTHANYATSGTHDQFHVLAGAITDKTSKGAMWDITRNTYQVKYNPTTKKFTACGQEPTSWLDFVGHWGDKIYPETDDRQSCPAGIDGFCQYQNGPKGPIDKQLDRENVCPDNGNICTVRTTLGP